MNSILLTLKTWLIILKIIQLVKYLLKSVKYIKRTKKRRNNKTKKHTPKQKELSNLFNDLLDTILTDKTLMSSKDKNEKQKEKENKKENEKEKEKEKENDKPLMSSKYDIENENDKTLMSSNEDNENENEAINWNNSNKIKELNDTLHEIIDKSKSFEDQIKSLEKVENQEEYWHSRDYSDKKLKLKFFKIKVGYIRNEIDKKFFEQISSHTFEELPNKLINKKKTKKETK